MRTHYDVLGVHSDATPAEIKASYRAIIKRVHPDRVSSLGVEARTTAEKLAMEANAAWDELSIPEKRALYDQKLQEKSRGTRGWTPNVTVPPDVPYTPRRPAPSPPRAGSYRPPPRPAPPRSTPTPPAGPVPEPAPRHRRPTLDAEPEKKLEELLVNALAEAYTSVGVLTDDPTEFNRELILRKLLSVALECVPRAGRRLGIANEGALERSALATEALMLAGRHFVSGHAGAWSVREMRWALRLLQQATQETSYVLDSSVERNLSGHGTIPRYLLAAAEAEDAQGKPALKVAPHLLSARMALVSVGCVGLGWLGGQLLPSLLG